MAGKASDYSHATLDLNTFSFLAASPPTVSSALYICPAQSRDLSPLSEPYSIPDWEQVLSSSVKSELLT